MGKPQAIQIDDFSGGLTQNIRLANKSFSSLSVRVDTDRTSSIRPYKDFEIDAVTESSLNPYGIEKFLYTGSEFFGFGRVSAANEKPQLYKKTSDDPTAVWTIETNGTNASSGARDTDLFVYYKNQDTIYGGNAGGIWSYTVAGDTFTHNENTSVNPTGNGVIHSKDDILYVPCGNVIASKNGAAGWDNDAFAGLPTDFSATSIAEAGNFLLVAGNRTKGGVLYFWDRDSSVNTSTDSVLFGDSTLKWVDTSNGVPIVCCTRVDVTTGHNEVVFYALNGNVPVEVTSFNAGASGTVAVLSDTQRYGTSIQFLMALTLDGELLTGIWSLSRKRSGVFKLDFITPPRNDTVFVGSTLKGFFRYPGYHFIAYLNEGDSSYTIGRTDDQANYTGTTRFHTVINPGKEGDSRITKKLIGVTVTTEPLPAAGQIKLKYRTDSDTSTAWDGASENLILTNSTDGSIRASAVLDATGANLPEYQEIMFRLESTGGAVITGLYFEYEEKDNDLY